MKKKHSTKRAIIIVVLAIIVVSIIVAIFLGNEEKPINVTFGKVERRTIIQTVSATGTIQPETAVKVAPEVSGEIVKLAIQEGDTVHKNQLLVQINPATIESQLEQYRAMVASSKSYAQQVKAQVDNLLIELNRTKDLYGKKFASKQDLDNAQANYDATLANYESALAQIKSSEANLKQIETEARKTTVNAPIDGVVTSLLVEAGERVVGTSMMAGTEMLTVSDLNVMNAQVDVDENDITLVKLGDTANVEIDAIPNKIYRGVVIEVGHSASSGTSTSAATTTTTFSVKIRLIDSEPLLRPGMSCNVEIHTAKHTDVLSVPLQAVTSREGELQQNDVLQNEEPGTHKVEQKKVEVSTITPTTIVWVPDGNKAKSKIVKIGISDMGYIEILEGLSDGEQIISGNYQAVSKLLTDGATIKAAQPRANASPKR
jgi:HlyD family secretion protein